jgi:hypothetical protein
VGARDVGDQGARRAWSEGLTGAREWWWDRVVVAMDARARAGGGWRTARARGGVVARGGVRAGRARGGVRREGVGARGSGGLVPQFGEYGEGRGGRTPELGEYGLAMQHIAMFGVATAKRATCGIAAVGG